MYTQVYIYTHIHVYPYIFSYIKCNIFSYACLESTSGLPLRFDFTPQNLNFGNFKFHIVSYTIQSHCALYISSSSINDVIYSLLTLKQI